MPKLKIGYDENNRILEEDFHTLFHLLIAGQTNSGKSFLLREHIDSLIKEYSPKDIKLCLIDAKGFEFKEFNNKNYLYDKDKLYYSDEKEVLKVLKSINDLIDKRSQIIFSANKNNILMYNINNENKLYELVICIDEIMDFLLVDEIRDEIKRILFYGNSVGVRIIATTQAVHLLSNEILAWFPSRICMKVISKEQSNRIIHNDKAMELKGYDYFYLGATQKEEVYVKGVL